MTTLERLKTCLAIIIYYGALIVIIGIIGKVDNCAGAGIRYVNPETEYAGTWLLELRGLGIRECTVKAKTRNEATTLGLQKLGGKEYHIRQVREMHTICGGIKIAIACGDKESDDPRYPSGKWYSLNSCKSHQNSL